MKISKLKYPSICLILLLMLFLGCDKEQIIIEPEVELEAGIETFYVENLATDSLATSSSSTKPMYYSLEKNQVVSEEYALTTEWDICFAGTYNGTIYVNNGNSTVSPGSGGPGKGLLYMHMLDNIESQYYAEPGEPLASLPSFELFDDAFDMTKEVPVSDEGFDSEYLYLDFFGTQKFGWAYYDFYGKMFPDSDPALTSHVCYSLPRVIIVKTAKGNYAKLIIYSMYKDAPTVPDRTISPGFLTLKYSIQRDGSTNLDHTLE